MHRTDGRYTVSLDTIIHFTARTCWHELCVVSCTAAGLSRGTNERQMNGFSAGLEGMGYRALVAACLSQLRCAQGMHMCIGHARVHVPHAVASALLLLRRSTIHVQPCNRASALPVAGGVELAVQLLPQSALAVLLGGGRGWVGADFGSKISN